MESERRKRKGEKMGEGKERKERCLKIDREGRRRKRRRENNR